MWCCLLYIDDSTKFERYHLLNQTYAKIFDYKKNIKPAPNPYYILDKYYGNLSIEEYRKLFQSDKILIVIDKPLTRLLPELHDENDIIIENYYGNNDMNVTSTGDINKRTYKVKRQSDVQKGPSKLSILRENFGI